MEVWNGGAGFDLFDKLGVNAWRCDLLKGRKAGHVALHEGESFLQIDAYDGDKRHTTGKAIRWLRLRGKLDKRAKTGLLTLQHATACEDPRPKTSPVQLTEEDLMAKDIAPGESFDISIEIKGGAGVYTAILKPPGVHYVALSRAFVIP